MRPAKVGFQCAILVEFLVQLRSVAQS